MCSLRVRRIILIILKDDHKGKQHRSFPDEEPYELEKAGIDPEKMGYLSGRERRLILRRAGLDPEKFDF